MDPQYKKSIRQLDYLWINPYESKGISGEKVVLFGAGKGAEEFLRYLAQMRDRAEMVAVVDNDQTFWGKTLNGHCIVSPANLKYIPFDKIVVTSISGRDIIASQLEQMGYSYPKDYILIGRFPLSYRKNFKRIENALAGMSSLVGSECLHIGPGGFLGLEVLLYCFGACRLCSVDKFGFGIHYPDITPLLESYAGVKESLAALATTDTQKSEVLCRFESLFHTHFQRTHIDSGKIDYTYPMDVCNLNMDDGRFDLAFSFGVLEHVSDPKAAVSEISRCSKTGGMSLHLIVTRDHRSNSKVGGNTPFAFRSYGADEWETISNKKFYQNRLLPVEWRHLFEENGFIIQLYQVGDVMDIDDSLLESFHPDFHRFSRTQLGELDCLIMAKKSEDL